MKFPVIEIKNRHHAVFVIAATLIAGLFVISIIAILMGKFTPFAAVNPTPPTARQTIAVAPAAFMYNGSYNTASSVQSNASSIVIAPYPMLEVTEVAGLADSRLPLNSLGGTITYKNNVSGTLSDVITNAQWNANGSIDRMKTELLDKSIFLNRLDALAVNYNLSVLVSPTNSLAIRIDSVTNYENPLTINLQKPIIPADFVVNNRIDDADINNWKAEYGKSGSAITNTNKAKDFNQDGIINEADYAVIFSEYYNRTGDTL